MTIFENIRGGIGYHHILKSAIRACIHLLTITTKGWEEAEQCDRSYDAGEWSGVAWIDNWQNEEERVVKLVALRFDISSFQLGEALMCWEYNESDCFKDHVLNKRGEAS